MACGGGHVLPWSPCFPLFFLSDQIRGVSQKDSALPFSFFSFVGPLPSLVDLGGLSCADPRGVATFGGYVPRTFAGFPRGFAFEYVSALPDH